MKSRFCSRGDAIPISLRIRVFVRNALGALGLLSFVNADLSRADSVTWEEQALRLQNVSASLLDTYPLGEPTRATLGIEGKGIISFLPKTNPKVGGKSENVPKAPVQTVPTAQLNAAFGEAQPLTFGLQLWVGYLPSGMESLIGLKAKINQSLIGMALAPELNFGALNVYASVGAQRSSAQITGAITAPEANDTFSAKTSFVYGALGLKLSKLGLWANGLAGRKDTISTFSIPADHTHIEIRDTLADSNPGVVTQLASGVWLSNGLQFAIAEVFVPMRLMMPRLMLSYQYEFGGKP